MGKSNGLIKIFYDSCGIKSDGETALLGFIDNKWYKGDCFDIQLNNWDMNSQWILPKTYDTIIQVRSSMFSNNPEDLIKRCHDSLNKDGKLFIDWMLGGAFYENMKKETYSIGWNKNGEKKDIRYGKYTCIPKTTFWDSSFEEDKEVILFKQRVANLNYFGSLTDHVKKEMSLILSIETLSKYFKFSTYFKTLWTDFPQLYILTCGIKI